MQLQLPLGVLPIATPSRTLEHVPEESLYMEVESCRRRPQVISVASASATHADGAIHRFLDGNFEDMSFSEDDNLSEDFEDDLTNHALPATLPMAHRKLRAPPGMFSGELESGSEDGNDYANESEDGDDYDVSEELAPVPWNPVLVPAPLVSLAFPKVTNRVTF